MLQYSFQKTGMPTRPMIQMSDLLSQPAQEPNLNGRLTHKVLSLFKTTRPLQKTNTISETGKKLAISLLMKKENIIEQNIALFGLNAYRKIKSPVKKFKLPLARTKQAQPRMKNSKVLTEGNDRQFSPLQARKEGQKLLKHSAIQAQSNLTRKSLRLLTEASKKPKYELGLHRELGLTAYEMGQLCNFHKAILQYSRGKPNLLKKAFLAVLNIKGIIIEEDKLLCDEEEFYKIHKFSDFIKLYRETESHSFRRSTMDHLKILFDRKPEQEILVSEIQGILERRMLTPLAKQLNECIEKELCAEKGFLSQKIKLVDFYNLCERNLQIRMKIGSHFTGTKGTIR